MYKLKIMDFLAFFFTILATELKIIENNNNFISFEPLNSSVALIVILGTILGDKSRHLWGICGAFLAIQDEVY